MPTEIHARPQWKRLNNVLPGDTVITNHIFEFGMSPCRAAPPTSLRKRVELRVGILGEQQASYRHDTDVKSTEKSRLAFANGEAGTASMRTREMGAFGTCFYVASGSGKMQLGNVMSSWTERKVKYLPVGGDQ